LKQFEYEVREGRKFGLNSRIRCPCTDHGDSMENKTVGEEKDGIEIRKDEPKRDIYVGKEDYWGFCRISPHPLPNHTQ